LGFFLFRGVPGALRFFAFSPGAGDLVRHFDDDLHRFQIVHADDVRAEENGGGHGSGGREFGFGLRFLGEKVLARSPHQ
jgi:hypothetical protein